MTNLHFFSYEELVGTLFIIDSSVNLLSIQIGVPDRCPTDSSLLFDSVALLIVFLNYSGQSSRDQDTRH